MALCTAASRLAATLTLVAATLTGCANYQPVRDFSHSATKLATSYTPIVDDIVRTCHARESTRRLLNNGPYDIVDIRMAAKKSCQPIADNVDIARTFGKALRAYSSSLATLAGARTDELGEAATSATEALAKLDGLSGTPSFDEPAIGAAQKLAGMAARELMQARTNALTRQILAENQQPLETTVKAMQTFTTSIYGNIQLKSQKAVLEGLMDELRSASTAGRQSDATARLPYRLAQGPLQDQLDGIQSKFRRNERFNKAAEALVAAHRELLDNFSRMSRKELFHQVLEFGTKVQDLGDSVGGLKDKE